MSQMEESVLGDANFSFNEEELVDKLDKVQPDETYYLVYKRSKTDDELAKESSVSHSSSSEEIPVLPPQQAGLFSLLKINLFCKINRFFEDS